MVYAKYETARREIEVAAKESFESISPIKAEKASYVVGISLISGLDKQARQSVCLLMNI